MASCSEVCASHLRTFLFRASKNESKWFLKISQDQMLLQTKPIKIFGVFWGSQVWKRSAVIRAKHQDLEKMYIVICLVHGF